MTAQAQNLEIIHNEKAPEGYRIARSIEGQFFWYTGNKRDFVLDGLFVLVDSEQEAIASAWEDFEANR